MREYKGKIDENDLALVIRDHGMPIAARPCPVSETGEIKPHMSSFLMEDGKIVSVFHVKPIYYMHRNGDFRPLSEVTHYFGNHRIIFNERWVDVHPRFLAWLSRRQSFFPDGKGSVSVPSPYRLKDSIIPLTDKLKELFPVGLTTTTYFPDANPETTTFDGYAGYRPVSATWATMRGHAGGESSDTDASAYLTYAFHNGANNNNDWFVLLRGLFLYDTSGIGSGQTVSAATFNFVCGTADNAAGMSPASNSDGNIVSSNPASNTAVSNSDYESCGTISFGSIAVSGVTTDSATYNTINLNASGIAAISKTGVTKLGSRLTGDFSDTHPGSSADNDTNIQMYMADQAGSSQDNKLIVTYAAGSTAVRRRIFKHH